MARTGDVPETARAIQDLNRFFLSPRSFNRARRELAEIPFIGIYEDLLSRPHVEPGRNAHLFFMFNDQRRHLAAHYESLHIHQLDLVLPFFDGRFVSAILSSSIDQFLLHRLYNNVMDLLVSASDSPSQISWSCALPDPPQISGRTSGATVGALAIALCMSRARTHANNSSCSIVRLPIERYFRAPILPWLH